MVTYILSQASAATTGDLIDLTSGIWNIEVIGDLGAATVTIEGTIDHRVAANAKELDGMSFSEASKKIEVLRGGLYVRAVVSGATSEPIDVIARRGSA